MNTNWRFIRDYCPCSSHRFPRAMQSCWVLGTCKAMNPLAGSCDTFLLQEDMFCGACTVVAREWTPFCCNCYMRITWCGGHVFTWFGVDSVHRFSSRLRE